MQHTVAIGIFLLPAHRRNSRQFHTFGRFIFEFAITFCDVNRDSSLRRVYFLSFDQDDSKRTAVPHSIRHAGERSARARDTRRLRTRTVQRPAGRCGTAAAPRRRAEARRRAPHKFAKASHRRPTFGKSGHGAQAPRPVTLDQKRGSRRYILIRNKDSR